MFRLKVERDTKPLLESTYKLSRDLVEEALMERPRGSFKRNQEWLVGNAEKAGADRIFFAFGKITKSIAEKYDDDTKSFTDVQEQQAPYTLAAVDLKTQVCVIASKVKIAPQVKTLADRLSRVLSYSKTAIKFNVRFVLSDIKDSESLIKLIDKADRIKRFELTFSLPNPWDVDKDFHKPQEDLLAHIGGKHGKTILEGDSLNKDVIKKTLKSVAATGNTASVRLRMSGQRNFSVKQLGGSPVSFTMPEFSGRPDRGFKASVFSKIAEHYNTIRGKVLPAPGKSKRKLGKNR